MADDPTRNRRNAMALAGAGLELAASVAGLTIMGWWLDGRWDTAPWLMLTGLAISLIGGMYRLWRIGSRFFQ